MVLPTVTVWTSGSPYKVRDVTSFWNCVQSLSWEVFPLAGTRLQPFPSQHWLPRGNSSSAGPIVSKSESQMKGHRCRLRTCWFLPGQLQHVSHMNPRGTFQVCSGMTEGEWERGDSLAEVKHRPSEEAYCAFQKSRSQSHVIGTHVCRTGWDTVILFLEVRL